MKVLFVPYGTAQAPATRYRVMQYLPYLKERGVDFRVFSAISELSTSLMIRSPDFGPAGRFLYYLYIYVERVLRFFYIIVASMGSDIVFLQRTTFPMRLECLLKLANANIVFDIDDAIYLPDKQSNDVVTRIKKYIKKTEVVNILKVSKCAIVENDYIGGFVSRHCGKVFKIPGPIDTERFFVRKTEGDGRQGIAIGWIGSPATTSYLHMLDGIFKRLASGNRPVSFKFIGLGSYRNPDIEFENVGWRYETEVEKLQAFDIGVMPMPDDEWTKGKLGCKMLQYMAVGIPAVVSYTVTNAEIIKDGENGFLVKDPAGWMDVLSRLVDDAAERKRIGMAGRRTVEERCSVEKNAPRLLEILKKEIRP